MLNSLFADLDSAPLPYARRVALRRRLGITSKPNHVLVVAPEIEAWYIAGVEHAREPDLGIPTGLATTDAITKERFNQFVPRKIHFPHRLHAGRAGRVFS